MSEFYQTFNSAFWLSMASLLLVCLLSSLKVCFMMKISEYNCCCIKVTRDLKMELEQEQKYDRIPQASRRNSLLPF